MSTLTPSRRVQAPDDVARGRRLARWSVLMLAAFVVVYVVTSFVGLSIVLPTLGLQEGDLFLSAHSVAGWSAAVVGWLLLGAAPVSGVWLGVRGRRLGAGATAVVGIVLNALVLLLVAYTVFDEIRMAYIPGFTFPFPS